MKDKSSQCPDLFTELPNTEQGNNKGEKKREEFRPTSAQIEQRDVSITLMAMTVGVYVMQVCVVQATRSVWIDVQVQPVDLHRQQAE